MILTDLIKLTKLLVVKIIAKHTAFKNDTVQAPRKMCGVKNILF